MEQKQELPPAWIVDTHNPPLSAVRERQALDVPHRTFRAPSVFDTGNVAGARFTAPQGASL